MSTPTYPSRYYTVDQATHLAHIALGAGLVLGALVSGIVIWILRDALDSFRARQFQRIEDETRDAKARVIGIANGAQAEMIRLLMAGRSRHRDR